MDLQKMTMTVDEQAIEAHLLPPSARRRPPAADEAIAFGSIITDHMLVCDYLSAKDGWQTPLITPFAPFSMRPDALAFHYGQQIFEGMKAYLSTRHAGDICLFRPQLNAERFHASAERLGMQAVPEALFLACLKGLISVESGWVPQRPGTLYIRPFLIPLDHGVSYRASQDYRFTILLSPTLSYFNSRDGVTVFVERERVRAARGGVGEAKCGGNYAASVASLSEARRRGADQVLWLDALEFRYVEEVGAMNIMFVYENEIVTPSLSGSILPGITRRSVLDLQKELALPVVEKKIAIDKILRDCREGRVREAFGCGTAAVISPIRAFMDRDETVLVGDGRPGPIAGALKELIESIQYDEKPAYADWLLRIRKGPALGLAKA